ncbi:MAG: 4'-phosphopantetheinyl transferase superfamily protein [Bacteroidales bacterium]|nr:MAG: 4'-phosphopantetheinyl transferase superfamily protein [Bacteroidales bacterium]
MGFYRLIDDSQVQIALWRITETEEDLKNLTGLDLSSKYAYPRRRIETMVVRAMLNHLNHFEPISYHPNGRPYYSDGKPHISISHTANMVVVAFSQELCIGVDIERVNRDFKIVANKYLSVNELQWINLEHQKSLALAWCIKESVYKLPWREAKHFINDISISRYNNPANSGIINVEVIDLNEIHQLELKYLFFDDFCLSWVVSNCIL